MDREIVVIAHNIRSAHNIGSLLRTCDAMGVKEVILSGYTPYPKARHDDRLPHIADKVNGQIVKTALGAEKSQSWRHAPVIGEVLEKASKDGYTLCSLEQSKGSIALDKFKPPKKAALILGNEVAGLEKAVLDKSDYIVEILMLGQKESLNVIQAAAIALYAFRFN